MNVVGIGTETDEFVFWEYLFLIFGIVSLQCTQQVKTGICTAPWRTDL
jgi:hypothetical protein